MRPSTIAGLVGLAGVLFAAWFFMTHEKVTTIQYTGYRGEARVNDFLAAELLLTELGIQADSRQSLTPSEWLPATGDTIVSRLSTSMAVGFEQGMLLSWISNGGHLVLLPPAEKSRLLDEYLATFGLRLVRTDTRGAAYDAADDGDAEDDESYVYLVDLENTAYRIEADYEDGLDATLSDDKGLIAARKRFGNGHLTLVSTSVYFGNGKLGQSDHARLLLDVIAGSVPAGKVWFIYDATFPSLWQVLWRNVPLAMVGAALVLALWLWSIVPRFGPAVLPGPPVRRSIVEHVQAAGHFTWRNHGARSLVAGSIAAVMHEAEFRHPGIDRLPVHDQAKRIAAMSGLPAAAILEVLTSRDPLRDRAFTRDMRLLQRIRKNL